MVPWAARARQQQPQQTRARMITPEYTPAAQRTVFPEPLRPTMSVSGFGNVITLVFSGLKLRTPLMRSFSTVAMRRILCAHMRRAGARKVFRCRHVLATLAQPAACSSLQKPP